MMKKSILFITSHSPYAGQIAEDMLNMILASASFGYELAILLRDQAVLQLKTDQRAENIGRNSFTNMYKSFELYDINNIFVEAAAMQVFNLDISELIIEPQLLTTPKIENLMQHADYIIGF